MLLLMGFASQEGERACEGFSFCTLLSLIPLMQEVSLFWRVFAQSRAGFSPGTKFSKREGSRGAWL